MQQTGKPAATRRPLPAAAVATFWLAGAVSAQTVPVDIGGRLEPFVDRHLIQALSNATLQLQRPVDKGIVFHSDMPWEGNRSVNYDANGATSGKAPAAQTKEHDVALTLALSGRGLGEATFLKKTGHTFSGWNTAADGSGTDYAEWTSYASNASMTLYAKWTAIPASYAVTFNKNGATSGWGPAALIKTHGVVLTLPSNITLAKTGHTFAGWNTAADGGGTNYDAGGNYTANAAVTLYAWWTPAGDTRAP